MHEFFRDGLREMLGGGVAPAVLQPGSADLGQHR